MRKHFLLLVLMALLPLAGWAEVTIGKVGVSNYYFGDVTIPVPVVKDIEGAILTKDTHYTYDDANVYKEKDGEAVPLATLKTEVAGTVRYVKIIGIGAYVGQTAWAEFTIQMATLAGATVSLSPDSYTYTGEACQPTPAVTHTTLGSVDAENYTVTYTNNTNAGTATVTITAKEGGNYQGEVVKTFNIAKATIPTEKHTAPETVSGLKYTGNAQALITAATIESADYGTIQYKVGAGEYSTTIPTATDAGNYTVSWKIVGGANYNDVDEQVLAANTIDKCASTLRIMPIAKTKPYDGEAFDIKDAQFTITGWAEGDNADVQKTLEGLDGEGTLEANAAEYTVKVKDATLTYKEGVELSNNYNIDKSFTASWKITKRPITIAAKNQSVVFGTATPAIDPSTMLDINGTVVGEDNVLTLGGISLAYNGKYTPDGGAETDIAVGKTDVPMGTYEAAFKVTSGSTPDNYELTLVHGNLVITGGAYDVIVTVPNTIQYGSTIVPSCIGLDGSTPVAVTKSAEADAIAYIYKKDGVVVDSPASIGTYTIEVDPSTIDAEGNYAGGTANCQSTPFNIVQKDLNLTLNSVALLNGDTKAILNSKKGAVIADYSAQLVGGETVDIELDFDLDGATKVSLTEGVLAFEEGYTAQNLITAAFVDGTNDNANYNLVLAVNGELTQSTDYAAALIGDGTAPSVIAAAAANGNAYDVTIGDVDHKRTLKGDTWNVVVLPFDVEPLAFCNATGNYAIFNRLKEVVADPNGSEDKIYFKIALETIPANEPFIVKPYADIELDGTQTFEDVVIKNDGATPVYADITNAIFTGTYNSMVDIESSDFWALTTAGVWKHFSAPRTGDKGLSFTKAYLEVTTGSSSARFFVEDLDSNGATAIKEISVDTMMSINDGLYDLNGVKMHGVPTQKGIYIQNGKKVVIK